MLSYQKGIVKTSVRHLIEFLLRTGSITTGSALSANPEAMLEGGRLHRKIPVSYTHLDVYKRQAWRFAEQIHRDEA